MYTQKEKARELHALHQPGKMLVLPNIWDTLGAIMLESLGYPAIATASAAIAYANGYNDGQHMPFDELLVLLKKIGRSVSIPVTADIENGYADNHALLQENIRQLITAGIVGINIEDTDAGTGSLSPVEAQCEKIRLIKEAGRDMDVPIFINARTDVYLHGNTFETRGAKFEEALRRGFAYKDAGAACFFPIGLRQEEDIRQMAEQLSIPLNILALPGIPALKTLEKAGVARVSLGPGFLKIAIKALKTVAEELKEYEGLEKITGNDVTSDYLKNLVRKNHAGSNQVKTGNA